MIYSLMFFDITYWFYLIAALLYLGYWIFRNTWMGQTGTILTFIALFSNTLFLVARRIESKHAPFSNLYESMVFFTWVMVIGYLFMEFKYKTKVVGAFVVSLAFVSMVVTSLLPFRFQSVQPLNPALQSIWLEIHVFSTFIGYAGFGISFGVSLMYLLKNRQEAKGRNFKLIKVFPEASLLDELAYKAIAWGFPFLTVGIVTGAIWANKAWGTYWSWDPKETWSLITWFIYAAYLHARITRGWRGKKAAYLSIFGFMAMAFLYWGVSFILPGLHAYA